MYVRHNTIYIVLLWIDIIHKFPAVDIDFRCLFIIHYVVIAVVETWKRVQDIADEKSTSDVLRLFDSANLKKE